MRRRGATDWWVSVAPSYSILSQFRDIKRLAVMNSTFQRIKAWRSRRQLRSLERWEQIRAEGKARFVFNAALTYGLTMVGLTDVCERIFYSAQHSISLGSLIYYLLGGIPIGLIGWTSMEADYQKALRETRVQARVQASPTGELPPHNSPLRITADSQSE